MVKKVKTKKQVKKGPTTLQREVPNVGKLITIGITSVLYGLAINNLFTGIVEFFKQGVTYINVWVSLIEIVFASIFAALAYIQALTH